MQKTKSLDPVFLGRPLSAFNAVASRVSHHILQHIQQSGHRTLRLQIAQASITPRHTLLTAHDSVVQLERRTVLQLMAQRYGFDYDGDELPPVSKTEERITLALHAAALAALDLSLGAEAIAATVTTQAWCWQAQVQVEDFAPARIQLDLGRTHSARLEHAVQQQRPTLRATRSKPAPLEIDIQAVLLEKTVTAADIQQLRVGSVLPISLERARVALNGQAMLSASVAEHLGTLHLTAFETLE